MKLIISIFIFANLNLIAQGENVKWYFGYSGGLDFTSNNPVALSNATVGAPEGCATVCDANGNLLFYSNGVFIKDQTHSIMANSLGLLGNTSSAQGVLIAKKPGATDLYYVFILNINSINPTGIFSYNIVDMSLAAGNGSVTTKNATLQANFISSECIAGARHCNGKDMWIVIRPYGNSNFYSYLLTSAGISTVAITSSLGIDSISRVGCLKISQSGKKIAYAATGNRVIVADFDNSTGIVGTNSIVLPAITAPYGIEFSADGSKLYTSSGFVISPLQAAKICQWDLCAGSNQAVVNSRYIIFSDSTLFLGGALQLARNGKIYKARLQMTDSIGVINFPNLAGAACGYIDKGQTLAGRLSQWGLPNFVSGYMKTQQPQFTYTANCQNVNFTGFPGQSTLQACSAVEYPITSSYWNFGDPASLQQNQSTQLNTFHYFTAPGTYTVQLIINRQCSTDTLLQTLVVPDYTPTFTISGRTGICAKESSTLNANGSYSYLWSNSASTSSTIVSPTTTTNYSVTATNTAGCTLTKTVTVVVSKCTGIAEENTAQVVQIFPNPSDGKFTVLAEKKGELKLYEVSGRCIFQKEINAGENPIDISSFNKGIYIINVVVESRSYYQRLVIN